MDCHSISSHLISTPAEGLCLVLVSQSSEEAPNQLQCDTRMSCLCSCTAINLSTNDLRDFVTPPSEVVMLINHSVVVTSSTTIDCESKSRRPEPLECHSEMKMVLRRRFPGVKSSSSIVG